MHGRRVRHTTKHSVRYILVAAAVLDPRALSRTACLLRRRTSAAEVVRICAMDQPRPPGRRMVERPRPVPAELSATTSPSFDSAVRARARRVHVCKESCGIVRDRCAPRTSFMKSENSGDCLNRMKPSRSISFCTSFCALSKTWPSIMYVELACPLVSAPFAVVARAIACVTSRRPRPEIFTCLNARPEANGHVVHQTFFEANRARTCRGPSMNVS